MKKTVEERFWEKIDKTDECWLWTASCDSSGYGKFWHEGKLVLAHRFAYAWAYGGIPEGMQVDHTCHVRACVKVEHLRLASNSENSRNRSGPHLTGTATGVRNVHIAGKKYTVRIKKHGKLHYFGVYNTVEEAARVAERERALLFGEFAGRG